VVIFHPDLVHEAVATTGLSVRRGIFARVCPHHVMPLYAERAETQRHPHDGHTFTNAYYLGQDPRD
jgi:hypothetical protein